jgi:hypothetical protein
MSKKLILYLVIVVSVMIVGFVIYDTKRIEKEIDRMKKEIAEYEARPEMPIELTYREAMLGPGLVVIFKNISDRHLSVVANFKNPTLNMSEAFRLDLSPNQIKEVGHAEGWAFASGDLIKVEHNEYKALTRSLP